MLDELNRMDNDFDAEVIALIDISHFSDNDGLGQEVGNNLLIAVADRLIERFAIPA